MERAYQEQSNIRQFLKVHPFFDPVRGDPHFTDLVHRVGLDWSEIVHVFDHPRLMARDCRCIDWVIRDNL